MLLLYRVYEVILEKISRCYTYPVEEQVLSMFYHLIADTYGSRKAILPYSGHNQLLGYCLRAGPWLLWIWVRYMKYYGQ